MLVRPYSPPPAVAPEAYRKPDSDTSGGRCCIRLVTSHPVLHWDGHLTPSAGLGIRLGNRRVSVSDQSRIKRLKAEQDSRENAKTNIDNQSKNKIEYRNLHLESRFGIADDVSTILTGVDSVGWQSAPLAPLRPSGPSDRTTSRRQIPTRRKELSVAVQPVPGTRTWR